MAKESKIVKDLRSLIKPKFSSRRKFRCVRCGRPRGYIRRYGLCRICFREMAMRGEISGVRKASW